MSPKISVIIPTYNRESDILRAIDSARCQTMNDLEVLVCDDGSTDKTKEIVAGLAATDRRIKWIVGEFNSGLPAVPRNRGIKAAQGEWLAFLDSDDEWLPEKLEKQLALAVSSRTDAVCANAWKDDHRPLLDFSGDRLTFSDLLRDNKVITSSLLVKRSLLEKAGCYFSESPALKAVEDYDLWLKIAAYSDIAFSGDCLLIYNDSADSIRLRGFRNFYRQKRAVLRDLSAWLADRKETSQAKRVRSAGRKNEIEFFRAKSVHFLKNIFSILSRRK